MANEKLFDPRNLQTILAVAFVLALLSVTFNFYNFTRIQQLTVISARANEASMQTMTTALVEARQQSKALQEQVDELEARLASMEPKPTPE